jgi:ribosomal protein S6
MDWRNVGEIYDQRVDKSKGVVENLKLCGEKQMALIKSFYGGYYFYGNKVFLEQ